MAGFALRNSKPVNSMPLADTSQSGSEELATRERMLGTRDSFSQNMARIVLEDTSQCQTLLNILAAESENSIVS